MATAWTKYEYKSPMAIDADTMGKVLTLKQQKYDANVAKVSELVSQFTNMNFIRDIDEEYLGKRLNKIVDYVNDMGAKDFASENVTRNITSYISSALDENVMAAIQSTQALQNQQAMIEKIKAEDPGKYNVANEWLAKQDLNRYANSGELGDVYRAQAYIPYVDINEKIIKNADVIEKFAKDIQVQYTDSGNPYFLNKITRETLSAEEARPWIERLIGDDGKQQLSINAMYKAQQLGNEEVATQYKGFIDGKIEQNNIQIKDLKGKMSGMNATQRKIAEKNISNLSNVNKKLASYKTKDTDRVSMLTSMETESVISGYANMFSYDRITDLQIDDTPFKLHKFNVETQLAQERFNFDRVQAAIDNIHKEKEYQLRLSTAIAKGEVDAKGNPILRQGDPQAAGINQKIEEGGEGKVEKTNTVQFMEGLVSAQKKVAAVLEEEKGISPEAALEEAREIVSNPGGQKWQHYVSEGSETLIGVFEEARIAGEGGRFTISEAQDMRKVLSAYSETMVASPNHGRPIHIDRDLWRKAREVGYDKLTKAEQIVFDRGVVRSAESRGAFTLKDDEEEAFQLARAYMIADGSWEEAVAYERKNFKLIKDKTNTGLELAKVAKNTVMAFGHKIFGSDEKASEYADRVVAGSNELWEDFRETHVGSLIASDTYVDESDAGDLTGTRLTAERREALSSMKRTDGTTLPSPIGRHIKDYLRLDLGVNERMRVIKDKTATHAPIATVATVDFSTDTGKNIRSSVMPFVPGEIDVKRAGEFKLQSDGSMQAKIYIKDQEDPHIATIPAISTPRALTHYMDNNKPTGHLDVAHPEPVKLAWSNIALFDNEEERAQAFDRLNMQEQAKYQSYQDFGKTVDEMKQVVKEQVYNNYEVSDEFKKKVDNIIAHVYHVETAKSNMGGHTQFVMTYRDKEGDVLGQVPLGVTNLEKYVDPRTAPTDYRIVEEIIATRIQNELKKEL